MESKSQPYTSQYLTTSHDYTGTYVSDPTTVSDGGLYISVRDGNVKGDHRTPNGFKFEITKASGGEYEVYTSGYLANQEAWTKTAGDLFQSDASHTPVIPVEWGTLHDRAMAKFYDQIRGKSNLIVDLAESRQTLQMIRNATRMRKVFGDFVKQVVRGKGFKRLSKGQARLDYVTSKWLEYRYGWMPLVYSTYDALSTLNRRAFGGSFTIRSRATERTRRVDIDGLGTFSSPQKKSVIDQSARTEMVIRVKLPGGNQLHDWTSLNPLGIAWELTPLSFVADWFVNVGDLLSAWENYAIFANQFQTGYQTDTLYEVVDYTWFGVTNNPVDRWPNGNPMDGSYFFTYRNKNKVIRRMKDRVRLVALPQPEDGLRLKMKLNSNRLLDAASLLHVFTRQKARGF